MQPALVFADSFECGRYDGLWVCWHNHTTVAMAIKLSPMLFSDRILSLNDAQTLSPHCHSLLFLVFNVIENTHNHSAKLLVCWRVVCWRVVSCNSGPESESTKFYRLQFRLRIRTKQSTWTDSNSGLDSDSAALHKIQVDVKQFLR